MPSQKIQVRRSWVQILVPEKYWSLAISVDDQTNHLAVDFCKCMCDINIVTGFAQHADFRPFPQNMNC